MYNLLLKLILSALLCLPIIVIAGPSVNTLWLGNNKNTSLGVLNVTRAGKILRRVHDTEATGIAIDASKNLIYFGNDAGQITARDLNSPALIIKPPLNPPVSNGRDMAFDGKFLWRTDTGNRSVQKIDPKTGTIVFSFEPNFYVIGIAWDGRHLWMSEYNGFAGNERIVQFTRNGVPTGVEFPAGLVDDLVGGLAFDSADGTLWLGARNKLYRYTTTGVPLGAVPIATSGRFIDGLEFQGIAACLQ